jgi:hypothetical protein
VTPREERAALLRSLDVAFDIQAKRLTASLDQIAQRANARMPSRQPAPASRKRERAITEVDLAYLEGAEDDDDFSE